MEKALEVRDLKKYYGPVKAVDGVSFYCLRVKCLLCSGPTEQGRPRSSRSLKGLREADRGEIAFLGKPCRRIGRAEKERIGVVLQQTNLLRRIKVREYAGDVRFFLQSNGKYRICWKSAVLRIRLILARKPERWPAPAACHCSCPLQ